MIKGIDVSSHQGVTYSLDGVDFVIVKATEGASYLNPRHAAQVQRARDHGRVVGHYHYVNGSHSMSEQASFFLEKASAKPGEILVLDWEETSVSGSEKDTFLKLLKSKGGGRKVLLYTGAYFWKTYDKTSYAADGLWVADYNGHPGQPSIRDPWLIHQYTSFPIDTNTAKFSSREEMAKWAGKSSTPAPKPSPAYAPFPGGAYFKKKPKSALIEAMGKRLVAEGYGGYKVGPGQQWTDADKAAYKWWQKKLGYTGGDADGWPGKTSWDKLKVPKS